MSNLNKRVGALEAVGDSKRKRFLLVDYPSDGGVIYNGQFYPGKESLLLAEGLEHSEALFFGWQGNDQTAAELLEEAAERKKNPPPKVSIDDLGEYGRQLVEEGITPAVAQLLEKLYPDGQA